MSAQQKSEAAIVADTALRRPKPLSKRWTPSSRPKNNDFCDKTNIRLHEPRKQVPHSCVCGCGKIARVRELVGQIR